MHDSAIVCAANELANFDPPLGQTCGQYLASYLQTAPGQLLNPAATKGCAYCPLRTSDQFLAGSAISWDTRWRNWGIGFAYIIFNIAMAIFLYWAFRVKKWDAASMKRGPHRFCDGVKRVGRMSRGEKGVEGKGRVF